MQPAVINVDPERDQILINDSERAANGVANCDRYRNAVLIAWLPISKAELWPEPADLLIVVDRLPADYRLWSYYIVVN